MEVTGRVLDTTLSGLKGHALVCGLEEEASFLSLRAGPSASEQEILKLNHLMGLELSGAVSADGQWLEVEKVFYSFDMQGRRVADSSYFEAPVAGWVSADYACSFLDF